MNAPQDTRRWLVYLLHFDRPVRSCLHYLGITKADRLDRRMAEHAAGTGAALTFRAAKEAVPFTLAMTMQADDLALERRLKASGHFRRLCPICRGELDLGQERRRYAPTLPADDPDQWRSLPPIALGPTARAKKDPKRSKPLRAAPLARGHEG